MAKSFDSLDDALMALSDPSSQCGAIVFRAAPGLWEGVAIRNGSIRDAERQDLLPRRAWEPAEIFPGAPQRRRERGEERVSEKKALRSLR